MVQVMTSVLVCLSFDGEVSSRLAAMKWEWKWKNETEWIL
jgi:hypothetical protein